MEVCWWMIREKYLDWSWHLISQEKELNSHETLIFFPNLESLMTSLYSTWPSVSFIRRLKFKNECLLSKGHMPLSLETHSISQGLIERSPFAAPTWPLNFAVLKWIAFLSFFRIPACRQQVMIQPCSFEMESVESTWSWPLKMKRKMELMQNLSEG